MRSWGVIALVVIAILGLVACMLAPRSNKLGQILVAKNATDAVWSKDSKKLFFFDSSWDPTEITQYVIETGGRTKYKVRECALFDISPDGRYLVIVLSPYTSGNSIWIHELASGKERMIYKTVHGIRSIAWPMQDRLIFEQTRTADAYDDVYLIDNVGKQLKLSVGKVYNVSIGADGQNIAYMGANERYYIHDLISNKRTEIPQFTAMDQAPELLYLSHRQVVYLDSYRLVSIDLQTMRARQLEFPLEGYGGDVSYLPSISPDFSMYVFNTFKPKSFVQTCRLYLAKTPLNTRQVLSASER